MDVQHPQSLIRIYPSALRKRAGAANPMAMLLVAAFLVFVVLQLVRQGTPPTELHAFRQTQTAISIREIVRGGPLLRYETPVLGPPWSIPFEFPLYQWIVAAIVVVLGTPLVPTARLVSSAMFILALLAANRILKRLGAGIEQRRMFLVLVLISPIYVYWSRTVMIESTALALTLGFASLILGSDRTTSDSSSAISWGENAVQGELAGNRAASSQRSTQRSHSRKREVGFFAERKPNPKRLWVRASYTGLAGVVGVLAALVKPTTFAGAAILLVTIKLARRERWTEQLRTGLLIGGAGLSAQLWAAYGDAQKMLNPIAPFTTSANLVAWNFGTFAQKLNPSLWLSYLERTFAESIGGIFSVLAVLAFLLIGSRRKWHISTSTTSRLVGFFIGGLAFLGMPAIFTNLYFVHQYYPYASVIYLLGGMAYAVAPAEGERWHRGSVGVASFVFASAGVASIGFLPHVIGHDRGLGADLINAVQAHTQPGEVLLVRGLDWSSELAYGADRRTIMDRSSGTQPPEAIRISLRNLAGLGQHIGGFISCGSVNPTRSNMEANYAHMLNVATLPTINLHECRVFTRTKLT